MLSLTDIENIITNSEKRVSSLERNGIDQIFQTIVSLKKEIGIIRKCLNKLEKLLPHSEEELRRKKDERLRCRGILTSLNEF
jgi:hypothetical protein